MNDRAGLRLRVVNDARTSDADHGSTTLYIINLTSSTTPMALEVPDAPELEGFAVFRSRRVEDGRDRYRLHLGYFESPQDAKRVLPVVRERYPAAWVAIAPQDSMGSLDDTSVAQFKFIRQNRIKSAPAPRAVPSAPKRTAPASAPMRATLVASPSRRLPATPVAPPSKPVAATLVPSPSSPPSVGRVPMTPQQVLQLLESAPRVRPQSAPTPRTEPGSTGAEQKFAVQLVWSTRPVLAGAVPQLAIFEAYTLYTVQVERAGRRWYGLRLGFFKDPLSARQVALYARSDFSAAAVVPVSDRECDKAGAVAAAAQAAPSARMPDKNGPARKDEITLLPDPPARTAPKAPVTRISGATRAPAPTTGTHGQPSARPQGAAQRQSPPQRSAAKRRVEKTAEELLEELGANQLAIDPSAAPDELNDSGVRHLSVSIVNRQSPIARLLDRVGRRRAH